MNKKIIAASVLMLALPLVSMAFSPGNIPNAVETLKVNDLIDIVFSIIWPVVVAFAIIMFILAAFMFFNAQGDPEKIASARNAVIWGVVGMVVALLAFSIPFIVRNTLDSGI